MGGKRPGGGRRQDWLSPGRRWGLDMGGRRARESPGKCLWSRLPLEFRPVQVRPTVSGAVLRLSQFSQQPVTHRREAGHWPAGERGWSVILNPGAPPSFTTRPPRAPSLPSPPQSRSPGGGVSDPAGGSRLRCPRSQSATGEDQGAEEGERGAAIPNCSPAFPLTRGQRLPP